MPGELLEEDGHTGSDQDQTREFTKVLIRPGWEVYGKGELLIIIWDGNPQTAQIFGPRIRNF